MSSTLDGVAYVTFAKAAQYCGYKPDYFRKMLKEYRMPKYGPKRNRYKLEDLDAWMKSPSDFADRGVRRYGYSTARRVVL